MTSSVIQHKMCMYMFHFRHFFACNTTIVNNEIADICYNGNFVTSTPKTPFANTAANLQVYKLIYQNYKYC